jgi:hypothetical protein
VMVASRSKVSFWPDDSISPGNHGYHLVYSSAAVRSLFVLNVGQIIETNTKTITKYTYFLTGANTFLQVGLRSAYSESWFFLRAKPSRQYKDTAFFTASASIWRTLANCKQISVLGTALQN